MVCGSDLLSRLSVLIKNPDPNDPLNWATWRKEACLATLCIAAVLNVAVNVSLHRMIMLNLYLTIADRVRYLILRRLKLLVSQSVRYMTSSISLATTCWPQQLQHLSSVQQVANMERDQFFSFQYFWQSLALPLARPLPLTKACLLVA